MKITVNTSLGKTVGALDLSLLHHAISYINICLLNTCYFCGILYLFPLYLFTTLWSIIPRIMIAKVETEHWNKLNKQQNQGANLEFCPWFPSSWLSTNHHWKLMNHSEHNIVVLGIRWAILTHTLPLIYDIYLFRSSLRLEILKDIIFLKVNEMGLNARTMSKWISV